MGLHFYDTSPSGPPEQLGRLGPARTLVKAKIPCVVWAEDALSIVHRVPTGLLDAQILVPDDRVHESASIICAGLPYSIIDGTQDDRWKDYRIFNKECPPAFNFRKSTLLMRYRDLEKCPVNEPGRVLVHAASTFHFDIQDLSRTCLNPSPPDAASSCIRFPTLPAFLDALIDTMFEPPLPFIHRKFDSQISCFLAYLQTYSMGEKGILYCEGPDLERAIVPDCLHVLEEVKEENRPFLTRSFLGIRPLSREYNIIERRDLKAARLARVGVAYVPPTPPYNPLHRAGTIVQRPSDPRLTPYLVRGSDGKVGIDWRPLARYMSITHRLCR